MSSGNISFDTGVKSFTINNDPNRVIRFCPTDANLIPRFQQAFLELDTEKSKLEDVDLNFDGTLSENQEVEIKDAARLLKEFEQTIREKINFIFASDVYDTVFYGQSPLSIVGREKRLLFEVVMDALFGVVNDEVTREQKRRSEKYMKALDKGKK